jgi:hypothetical protein
MVGQNRLYFQQAAEAARQAALPGKLTYFDFFLRDSAAQCWPELGLARTVYTRHK